MLGEFEVDGLVEKLLEEVFDNLVFLPRGGGGPF